MRCRVRKSRKSAWSKLWCFCPPNFGGRAPKFLWGICKSTSLPTYWPSLVEIPWSVFIYTDEIKIKITAVKYNGLAFGGHNKAGPAPVCWEAVTQTGIDHRVLDNNRCSYLHVDVSANTDATLDWQSLLQLASARQWHRKPSVVPHHRHNHHQQLM